MKGSENLPVDQAHKLRERNRLFWQNIFNPVAYQKLSEDAENLEKQIKQCTPENRFDEIVLDNMQNFAESSKDLAGFLTQQKDITAPEAINSVYGEGTFQRIKKELKEYNWEENYRYKQLEMERNKVDPRRYKDKLEKTLNQVSNEIEEYGREKGLVPEELSMNVVPIPSSRKQRAFYNAEQKEVNIGLDYFNVVKQNNELTICSVEVVYAIFHEFIGHATHQHNSMKLKHPRFTDRPIEDMMANAHAEAVGIKSNQYAKKFLEEKKERNTSNRHRHQNKKFKDKSKRKIR